MKTFLEKLDDEERNEIVRLIESPKLYNSIQKALRYHCEQFRKQNTFDPPISNELLGAIVRAQTEAKELLHGFWKEIEKLKPDSPQRQSINEAR